MSDEDYQAFMDSQLPVTLCPKCGSEMHTVVKSRFGYWIRCKKCRHEEKVKT